MITSEHSVLETRVAGLVAPVCVDAGANVGEWTAAALDANPGAHVFAFEPQQACIEALDSLGPRVTAACAALGDENDTAVLRSSGHPTCLGASIADRPGAGHTHEETVEVRRLDDAMAAQGITRIHVLKVDVEGHELDVLCGAVRLLENGIDVVQFEFNDCGRQAGVTYAAIHMLLADCGYECFRMMDPASLIPAPTDVGGDDNYLAVRP